MIDFSRLRGGPDGWRGSFEHLVCHLAELNPPQGAVEFRPIEGAGGDGGIEAYWVCSDGSEVGYQAKYHLRAGEIDWSALDASVETALDTHPALVRIIIVMPCDLTDVKRGRGTSARQKWNTRRDRWSSGARPREINFEFVGASQIERMLAKPSAAGLREYWLADKQLSDEWFRHNFSRTVAALDERYHPEDHVDVQATSLFHALRGSPEWRNDLERRAKEAALAMPAPPDPESAIAGSYEALTAAVGQLSALADERVLRSGEPFPTETWLEAVGAAILACQNILRSLRKNRAPDYELRRSSEEVVTVENVLSELRAQLCSECHGANQTRYAIIEGAAGSGKSHLMATAVKAALDAGEPAIMLLGTDFTHGEEPGIQIARRLELIGMSTETLLGALEAAAASRGKRALIAIDALNEGAGARYWRDRLAAFAAEVRRCPRVALCVSCRDVYSDRVFSPNARATAATVQIEGFLTNKEQETAARVYMDRRGIIRPATPWLPPEFMNPLFLRTACMALQKKGQRQFPLGLRGAREMIRFYFNAAAATLGTEYDGTNELEKPLIQGVLDIAAEMARARVDYVERHVAAQILDEAFRSYRGPAGRAWVDVLRLRGLLRADPPEHAPGVPEDPLDAREDVLRFAFQRIQDQLIARSLTQGCASPENLFDNDGPLHFLIAHGHIEHEWHGVFAYLTIEFADQWKAEIVDYMPSGLDRWWRDDMVQEAFIESIRWRQHGSFQPRTLEFLNALEWPHSPTDVLVELSVVEGHPWNADMLHRNLVERSMPERDAFWTIQINGDARSRSAAMRLAEWALGPGPESASDEVIRLALTALGWLFTSTNGALRDTATKAVTEVLLRRPVMQEGFLALFADVDDVYVIERVLAAVAGACLREPTPERVTLSAESVWHHVFAKGNLPAHLLFRDYARLIIELAEERGALPEQCDIQRCTPPYGSAVPQFGIDKAQVEAACRAVGDHSIFASTVGWGGDFGNYVVKNRAREFSSTRLSSAPPLRIRENYDHEASSAADHELKLIDEDQARLWIARRAIQLGWTEQLFPRDHGAGDETARSKRIERIGKKYQWIAYHELMARLADNYWLAPEWDSEPAKAYDTPLDLPYIRDIDPTARPRVEGSSERLRPDLPAVPRLAIEGVKTAAMYEWVFADGVASTRLGLGLCPDLGDQAGRWLTLYRYASRSTKHAPRDGRIGAPLRLNDFHFILLAGIEPNDLCPFVAKARTSGTDFHDWMVWGDLTDGPFLYEAGVRRTWPDSAWVTSDSFRSVEQRYLRFSRAYRWEHHLDGTLPNGLSLQVPSPWLLHELDLTADPASPGVYINSDGHPIIVSGFGDRNTFCIARRDAMEGVFSKLGIAPIWLGIGERGAWPDPAENAGPNRRWNGILWQEAGLAQQEIWAEDHRPGEVQRVTRRQL